MRSEGPGAFGPQASDEASQQCAVREANELAERANMTQSCAPRTALRCECGDAACLAALELTHAEYETVRAYGSHFLIERDHENPESSWVLRENARFAVIDVVAGDARYHVRARNPRHAWTDARDRSAR
jgi:hypothetical protein